MHIVSVKTLERLIVYRRQLLSLAEEGRETIYSHELARSSGSTPAKVRRDLMEIGYTGSSVRGYQLSALIAALGDFIDTPLPQAAILVGAGDLGRAILSYFHKRREKLTITAAFDIDPAKTGTGLHGCPCYHTEEMAAYIKQHAVLAAVLTLPAEAAQPVAEQLADAGITGILNYAPVRLDLPDSVYVENRDMSMALEKTAFYARLTRQQLLLKEGFS